MNNLYLVCVCFHTVKLIETFFRVSHIIHANADVFYTDTNTETNIRLDKNFNSGCDNNFDIEAAQ